jgi:hypothetical protein
LVIRSNGGGSLSKSLVSRRQGGGHWVSSTVFRAFSWLGRNLLVPRRVAATAKD